MTHEKSLDCLERGVGTDRRQSFDDYIKIGLFFFISVFSIVFVWDSGLFSGLFEVVYCVFLSV